MTPKDFAAWIAYMRESRGWSGAKCARMLGCGVNTIPRWIKDGAPPYIGFACAALAYGLPAWRKPPA
jgi:transcriptional regulator with XRE-family HTH domain